jgi:putative IMPACT (imprinted ancient) family translation regulator
MLEVLKRSGLSNILFICTRYFGGTLLGAGGLVHAYTKSAVDTLAAVQRVELIPCSIFKCSFSYGVWAKAEKALGDAGYAFEDVTYTDSVEASVCVTSGREDAFAEHVTSLSLGKTQPELIGQKLTEVPVPAKT